jgi:uncharacterized membrane protein YgdD (TMEM256/DUF423 family)
MIWTRRNWMTLAAAGGFLAVCFGAFAAHGVSDPKAKEWLHTGSLYGFLHSFAVFACAGFMELGAKKARFAPAFFLAGVLVFSGSLYAMAFGAPRWFGAITPIGGLSFMAGWAILGWAARDLDRD